MEGFKNTRKGTNIAAQATAIGLATVNIYFYTLNKDTTLNSFSLGYVFEVCF